MKKLTLLAASVLAAAMMAPVASQANYTPNAYFNGYFRGGVQHGNAGKANKHSVAKVGRLGNENDTYGEIGIAADVADADGVVWSMNSMLAVQAPASGDSNWEGLDNCAWVQYWGGVKGLIDWSKDAMLWAGNRYYHRPDSHIIDMKWINSSGFGAGLEGLEVGPGKLSLAWVRNDENTTYLADNGYSTWNTNANLMSVHLLEAEYGFPLWDGAWLDITETFYQPEHNNSGVYQYMHPEHEFKNSNALTIDFTQSFSAGWNKTVLQYGHGIVGTYLDYGSAGMVWGNSRETALANNVNAFRLLNVGVTDFGGGFSMIHSLNLHYIGGYDNDVENAAWNPKNKKGVSLVLRPQYQLTKMTKLLAEVGFNVDKTEYFDGHSELDRAQKVTLAYAIAPNAGDVWSRPEFRFYISYIHGSDNQDMVGHTSAGGAYNNLTGYTYNTKGTDNNTIFGIQCEAWW